MDTTTIALLVFIITTAIVAIHRARKVLAAHAAANRPAKVVPYTAPTDIWEN